MANRCGNNGNSDRLYFLGLQNHCSHEIKRSLLLGRKATTKPNSILKSRDITLSTKIHIVEAMVFPVVMYGCESWTIKKVEHWRNDVFELWCWRSLLEVPWTARRSNQSILKEINPEYSLEELMLKLKLQHFGHLRQRIDSLEGGRRRGWQRTRCWMASWTQWTWVWAGPVVGDGQGSLACYNHVVTKSQTRLSDWSELIDKQIETYRGKVTFPRS